MALSLARLMIPDKLDQNRFVRVEVTISSAVW
jgi:hypothetical protein